MNGQLLQGQRALFTCWLKRLDPFTEHVKSLLLMWPLLGETSSSSGSAAVRKGLCKVDWTGGGQVSRKWGNKCADGYDQVEGWGGGDDQTIRRDPTAF